MDVRCDRCQTEYELDDASVTDSGASVQCTTCGHTFVVTPPRPAGTPPPLTPGPAGNPTPSWMLTTEEGKTHRFRDSQTLQKWVVERRVTRGDRVCPPGGTWRRLGDLDELRPFFDVVAQADRAAATARGARPTRPETPRGSAQQARPYVTADLDDDDVLTGGRTRRPAVSASFPSMSGDELAAAGLGSRHVGRKLLIALVVVLVPLAAYLSFKWSGRLQPPAPVAAAPAPPAVVPPPAPPAPPPPPPPPPPAASAPARARRSAGRFRRGTRARSHPTAAGARRAAACAASRRRLAAAGARRDPGARSRGRARRRIAAEELRASRGRRRPRARERLDGQGPEALRRGAADEAERRRGDRRLGLRAPRQGEAARRHRHLPAGALDRALVRAGAVRPRRGLPARGRAGAGDRGLQEIPGILAGRGLRTGRARADSRAREQGTSASAAAAVRSAAAGRDAATAAVIGRAA